MDPRGSNSAGSCTADGRSDRSAMSLSSYARACVFLASDDAEMITGTDLRVDAGAIAKYWPWIPHA